jgi:hypothetical protein
MINGKKIVSITAEICKRITGAGNSTEKRAVDSTYTITNRR